MKLALLRLQAKEDRKAQVRYYRDSAGHQVAVKLVEQARHTLELIQANPDIGSPRLRQLADVAGLSAWRETGFPLVCMYFEQSDHLDVIRMLGERRWNGGMHNDYQRCVVNIGRSSVVLDYRSIRYRRSTRTVRPMHLC